jgi:hypothetical protein
MVVIASSNDVRKEREALDRIIQKVNRSVAKYLGLSLQAVRWETDSYPGFHADGPQALIDSFLKIEDCDILIGIFWKRFGTPIKKKGRTGTEHEFYKALKAWKKNGKPHIMLYFKQFPKRLEESEQQTKVLNFKGKIAKLKGLYWEYGGLREFEDLTSEHLSQYLQNRFRDGNAVQRPATSDKVLLKGIEKKSLDRRQVIYNDLYHLT